MLVKISPERRTRGTEYQNNRLTRIKQIEYKGTFLVFASPLYIVSSPLWLRHVDPCFITSYQIINHRRIKVLKNLRAQFTRCNFLILGEKMGYPPCTNFSITQMIFQNGVNAALWNARTTTYFCHWKPGVFYHSPHSFNVCFGY